jgi:thymidylate kinase
MLVAIAGPDGAGKSTLTTALRQTLHDRGFDAVRLDRFDILDPRLSPASGFIDTDVLTVRQSVLAMPTATARLLFILWSMAITASSQLKDAPEDRVIIYDSYWMKHTAAEIIFGADEQAALATASLLPPADLTFYVNLPPEALLARKPDDRVAYECGMDGECRPESFLAHQRRIQSYLDAWSERFGWLEVDGAQSTRALADDLSRRIEAALPPRSSAVRGARV